MTGTNRRLLQRGSSGIKTLYKGDRKEVEASLASGQEDQGKGATKMPSGLGKVENDTKIPCSQFRRIRNLLSNEKDPMFMDLLDIKYHTLQETWNAKYDLLKKTTHYHDVGPKRRL